MAATPKDTAFQSEARSLDAVALIKDLLGTAVITFLLLTPIVSYKTIMNQGALVIDTRWISVLQMTGLVVLGRLLLQLFVWNRAAGSSVAKASGAVHGAREKLGTFPSPCPAAVCSRFAVYPSPVSDVG